MDNLGVLATRIERITHKHRGLNILPEHYHVALNRILYEFFGPADELLAA
jgi:nitric oxide dioxygenase